MRLIDADALKKEMLEIYEYEYPTASGAFDEFASRIVPNIISNAPTVDAEPVRHGHWIHTGVKNVYGGHQHKCSVCGYTLMVSPMCDNEHYCCSCGAKMDEVSDEC